MRGGEGRGEGRGEERRGEGGEGRGERGGERGGERREGRGDGRGGRGEERGEERGGGEATEKEGREGKEGVREKDHVGLTRTKYGCRILSVVRREARREENERKRRILSRRSRIPSSQSLLRADLGERRR